MILGEKIKSIRQENKLSQEEFSEKFNVTRQTVSNWENGKSVPDLETIVRMSSEFNVSTDELLKEDKSVVQKIDSEKKKKNTLFMILIVLIVGVNFSGIFFYKELQKKNTVSFTMKDNKTMDVKNGRNRSRLFCGS
ncbi:helix-turn-helix domain-containing protein [Vagococcus carniphilus]|uniref:helix-turn-helix domain-containing protein n=1 Tax=Vagococcus carniphilus TaxID=218144 RepID=UPI00289037D9|nr:helix-turn-helix domain-containing protein [Vagococcus carniphilus]MDT2829905.1 helix-turn-helix domain-containing protein [Vagococcus carniphilus]MDT2838339.1 helix-turn-helix domain-containing protein [Vagococcus carniphilus]MDT2854335.1 helix-turn-helix domain-containing protein [Vagococcus carniphilus]